TAEGVIERVPNPAPLARNLTVLRRRSRSLSRSQCGSNRCRRKERRRVRLQAHLAALRRHEIPRLTTPHGRIVGEGLDAAGRLRQKGLPGARARRRGPAEAALAKLRRQLHYKVGWYGSEVVEAERCFASSRTCHGCGSVQDLGRTSTGGVTAVGRAIGAMTTPRSTWRGIGPGHPTKLAWWGPRPWARLEPPGGAEPRSGGSTRPASWGPR
ncbi:MAG TPA: zinc ribbon domain-containing protein, partial [Candidatus Dormibacteraeota bacterium]|nr:zinc ribbon domain-containing protein [Candidatus Dormibacteraeota bacterium]